jgi:hypothetical protein
MVESVGAGLPRYLLSIVLAEPVHFSWFEIGLLMACSVASGALFFWRLGPILKNILRSKKDADFSLQPIGRRVWEFFWDWRMRLCSGGSWRLHW